jgi:hypothetical protein
MTPEDRQPFLEVVLGFAELKGKHLSAPALELYWRAMRNWSLDDFRAAAEQLLRTCEFMPVPADFEGLRRAGKATSGEAWVAVLEHCTGPYRYGEGIDNGGPIDQAVAVLGGYRAVAMHNSNFLHALERRFAEHYASGVEVSAVRAALPQIAANNRPRIRREGPRHLIGEANGQLLTERERDGDSNYLAGRAV